jgi:hypothetical protein
MNNNSTLIRICFLIFFLAITFTFCACRSTKPFTSNLTAIEVNDIQKFETVSQIMLIKEKNIAKFDDSLSLKSKSLFEETLQSFSNIPVTGNMSVQNERIKWRVQKEIEYLCTSAERLRSISTIKLTPILDSLLESKGKRFGLITYTTGFTRKKGNYLRQLIKGLALSALTLGMYIETPTQSYSNVYAMIVDAKENNIAFFKISKRPENEPLNPKTLKMQINEIFEGYFWAKK